jgi:hypothetical protein
MLLHLKSESGPYQLPAGRTLFDATAGIGRCVTFQ